MKKTIVVFGATGAQGGSVVKYALKTGNYNIRIVTRNKHSERASKLAKIGCEVIEADLKNPKSLISAFKDTYGAFVVTNAWDTSGDVDEIEQGKNAVFAAKEANVKHFIWSTLPNSKDISGGKYLVNHFTAKAQVDRFVKEAQFPLYTFVEAPMYFQNLASDAMSPQLQEDGSKLWMFPMDPDIKGIHNGDISEIGKLVVAAFENPDKVGNGEHLAYSPKAISWQEIVDTLNTQGHNIKYTQVPNDQFDSLPFPGAKELREMMNFWEEYTYYGPNADEKIALANDIVPEGFQSFENWAKTNMRP